MLEASSQPHIVQVGRSACSMRWHLQPGGFEVMTVHSHHAEFYLVRTSSWPEMKPCFSASWLTW